jgi:transposase
VRKENIQWQKKTLNNKKEIQNRKLCARLHSEGKNVTQIHKELNRTRDWVYKWIKRLIFPRKSGHEVKPPF